MHLSCQKGFFLFAALTIACHESTTAASRDLYLLETVNGQPVPAIVNASATDTTTLLGAQLTLDAAGKAEIRAQTRHVSTYAPPRVATDVSRYSYRILGDSIAFDFSPPCPPNALCARPPYGKLIGSTVNLFLAGNPDASYIYRLAPGLD
jgi:hypothetical protein